MYRGLIESILIHSAILLLLLVGSSSLGGGSGSHNSVSLQMSTFIVDKHDPGAGDAPASANEAVAGSAQESAPEPETEPTRKPEPAPRPELISEPEPIPIPPPEPISEPEPESVPEQEIIRETVPESVGGFASGPEHTATDSIASGESLEHDGTGADGGSGSGAAVGGTVLGSSASDGIFTLKEVDIRPAVVNNKRPEYPRYAKNNRISGYVRLSFVVDKKGQVQEIKVIEASPVNVFESAAVAAAESWKFAPGKKGGSAVSTRVMVDVKFNLEEY